MIRFEHSLDIDRAPVEVFAYMTDVAHMPEWQSGVLEVELQGAMAKGTRTRELRKFLGKRLEMEQEVTAYEPGRRFGVKTASGPFPVAVTMLLKQRKGGTTLRFKGQADTGGFFKHAEPLVARLAERQVKTDLETLKDILEGGATGSA